MKSIMYHYVQNFKKEQKYLNFLSLSSFKKQVNFFEKKYNFFDTDELFYKKKFKKDAIFLTFDDGLKCHYKVAKDILYPKNIKGIFFIPALDYKKKNILSVHKIHFLLARFGPEKILNAIKNLGYHKYIDKKNLSKFGKIFFKKQVNKKNYIKVKKILNFYIIEKKRTQFITQLFYTFFSRKFEKKIFDEFYLSLDQVKQMSKMGMIIGSIL